MEMAEDSVVAEDLAAEDSAAEVVGDSAAEMAGMAEDSAAEMAENSAAEMAEMAEGMVEMEGVGQPNLSEPFYTQKASQYYHTSKARKYI